MAIADGTEIISSMDSESIQSLIERNRKTNWPDLEPYQKAFAYSFVTHYNHHRAAKEAGLAASSGIGVLRHPLVAAFIAHLQEKQATNLFITKDYITTQYVNMIPMLMGEEEVPVILANGDTVYGKQFRPSELRGVLQELSKTVEGFDKNKNVGGSSGGMQVNINLSSLVGGTTIEGEIVSDD